MTKKKSKIYMTKKKIFIVCNLAPDGDSVQCKILGKHISDVCIYLSDCIHIRHAHTPIIL